MDLFLLSYFRSIISRAEVGVYGLSQKIILVIITTVISITQILSPNFSKIKTKIETRHNLKTGLLYLLIPSALFCLLYITPNQIFYFFFTEKFAKTAIVTKALALPFILFPLSNLPQLFLLYTVRKPMPILIANIVFFIILTTGCYYLIPIKGVFGPPYAILAAFVVNTAILTYAAIKAYKKLPS
jgi:O-antigen/teichoic acid export membrane protein